MFRLKVDVIGLLRDKGYTSYYAKKDGRIGQKAFSDMRAGIVPGIKTLDSICNILNCQLSDIIEHVTDTDPDTFNN